MNRFPAILLLMLVLFSGPEMVHGAEPVNPPLPKVQSPVQFFRELLAADPAERDEMLKDRTEAQRRIIDEKLTEYTLLPPPIREWRLKATELRFYLMPLMKLEPARRGVLLETIPDEDRSLVEARLAQWDRLPAAERADMLNSDVAIRYLTRPRTPPLPPGFNLNPDSEAARMERSLAQWREHSETEQKRIQSRFNSFFLLSEGEKQKTLGLFTGAEQRQLGRTIELFAGMPEEIRMKCVDALDNFLRMSPEQRQAFLKSAERWQQLSESERRQWRSLATRMPPLPPGFVPDLDPRNALPPVPGRPL